MSELPKRRKIRLPHHSYGENGVYFITICTKGMKKVLWTSEFMCRGDQWSPAEAENKEYLSDYGKILDEAIQGIPQHYPHICVDKYIIMPNHLHLLLAVNNDDGRPMVAPKGASASRVVQQLKGIVTKRCGTALFQRSFFDRIIRSEREYLEAWKYIDENPCQQRKNTDNMPI